jgi:DNA-binding SARP family transcriptional activator/tetratricopeptide (TPR) repeat protein
MRFGLLGPLAISSDDEQPIDLRGAKVRVFVAALLCRANRAVAPDALADVLWAGTPPRQAGASIRVYVHHLRQALGEGRIERRSEGYALLVRPDELDVDRFRRLVEQGREAAARGALTEAGSALRAALALWRGPALVGFEGVEALRAEAAHLEELRLDALEQRFDVELALGGPAEIVAELRALAAEHPLRETFRAQLMRALVGAGRTAEAIAVFEETRRLLADEFGLDPGPRLRELHLAILREDEVPPAPVVTVADVVPRQLPPDMIGFAGRTAELEQLDQRLPGPAERPTATGITTIAGTAGLGKTALAVHWAHRVAERFPDGQMYVNLHGFDPARSPMDPSVAIGLFLGALGVPPQQIPVDGDARESLYRSLLADRRVLVVLDNAHDTGQVRPLLPGSAGCFVVVTSRSLLTGLIAAGAHPITPELLTPAEAGQLLERRLGSERTAAEPAAIDAIVSRCAGLPLALSIVAARAVSTPRTPLATLAAELSQARRALDGFASDDTTVDPRAVFSWSYRVLSPSAARLFRLLSLQPGPEMTVPAAASLAGLTSSDARAALTELSAANLLGEPRPGRFAFHDLLRAYAMELAEADDPAADREQAVRRALDHYVHTANPAVGLLDPRVEPTDVDPPLPGVTPEVLADSEQANEWFAAEHAVLLAAVARAAEFDDPRTWQLAWSLGVYLDRRGYWPDKIAVQRLAVRVAQHAGNRSMAARTLRSLGRTYGRLRQYEKAHEYATVALELYRDLGDVAGQAHALGAIAETLEFEGRYREALAIAQQSHELYRMVGNPIGEAQALNNIGFLHALLGEYEQTIDASERAIALFVAAGDRAGQSAAYDSLGFAYHNLGRYDDAIACYRQALDALAETGFRYFAGITLNHLGDTYDVAGDRAEARATWRRALAIFAEVGASEAKEVRGKLFLNNIPTPT